MPGQNSEFDDMLTRAWMMAWFIPIIWMLKWTIRSINFSGLWPLLIIVSADGSFTHQGIDVPDVVWGLLIGAGILFSIYWTTRNIRRRIQKKRSQSVQKPLSEQYPGGFIFGYQEQNDERQTY